MCESTLNLMFIHYFSGYLLIFMQYRKLIANFSRFQSAGKMDCSHQEWCEKPESPGPVFKFLRVTLFGTLVESNVDMIPYNEPLRDKTGLIAQLR